MQNATWNADQTPLGPNSSAQPPVEPTPPQDQTELQNPRTVGKRERGSGFGHRPPTERGPPPRAGVSRCPHSQWRRCSGRAGGRRGRQRSAAAARRQRAAMAGADATGRTRGAALSAPGRDAAPDPPVGPRGGSGRGCWGPAVGFGSLLHAAPQTKHRGDAAPSGPRSLQGDVASLGTSGLGITGQTPRGARSKPTRDQARL